MGTPIWANRLQESTNNQVSLAMLPLSLRSLDNRSNGCIYKLLAHEIRIWMPVFYQGKAGKHVAP
jgi:hypothetical protein